MPNGRPFFGTIARQNLCAAVVFRICEEGVGPLAHRPLCAFTGARINVAWFRGVASPSFETLLGVRIAVRIDGNVEHGRYPVGGTLSAVPDECCDKLSVP